MTVFVVESGDYEQRCVYHVAASLNAAVRAIRKMYTDHGSVIDNNPPVKTQWSDNEWNYSLLILEQGGHRLTTPIQSDYGIEEWEVAE